MSLTVKNSTKLFKNLLVVNILLFVGAVIMACYAAFQEILRLNINDITDIVRVFAWSIAYSFLPGIPLSGIFILVFKNTLSIRKKILWMGIYSIVFSVSLPFLVLYFYWIQNNETANRVFITLASTTMISIVLYFYFKYREEIKYIKSSLMK